MRTEQLISDVTPKDIGLTAEQVGLAIDRFLWSLGLDTGGPLAPTLTDSAFSGLCDFRLYDVLVKALEEDISEDAGAALALIELSPCEFGGWLASLRDVSWWTLSLKAPDGDAWRVKAALALKDWNGGWPDTLSE